MDGGDVGELEFENFNAASAKITIKGVSVHPGYAKDKMINANALAAEFAKMLPEDETPETTEGYAPFDSRHQERDSGKVQGLHAAQYTRVQKQEVKHCVAGT